MAFNNPIVTGETLAITGIRSNDYVEEVSGWRIARDGTAQFAAIASISDIGTQGQVSAALVTADAMATGDITIDPLVPISGSASLVENMLSLNDRIIALESWRASPQALLALGEMTATGPSTTADYQALMELRFTTPDNPTDSTNIMVELIAQSPVYTEASGSSYSSYALRITGTIDGSAPTYSGSTIYARTAAQGPTNINSYTTLVLTRTVSLVRNTNYRLLLSIERFYGIGGWHTSGALAGVPIRFTAKVVHPGVIANTAISAWETIPDPDPDPEPDPTYAWYSTPYLATWSQSYDANNGQRDGGDGMYCYQGYYSSTHGDTKSLVGFDWAQIVSDLAGADNITGSIKFQVAHTYNSGGTPIKIGWHSNSAGAPGTYANASTGLVTTSSLTAGGIYTIPLDFSFLSGFKTGARTGIAFGPYGSNTQAGYAYINGWGRPNRPVLTINYRKAI